MKKLTKIPLLKKEVKKLPEAPGVYIFWSKDEVLYIGKAINLKKRVESYLSSNLAPKTKKMVKEAQNISFIEVNSEIESLLLEANLIREKKPKFNVELKDDKHPLYIKITKEEYPRVLTARKIDENKKNLAFFGPFPSSRNVRSVLKMLRKIFPYAQHVPKKKPCLYSQMGLCNPCPSRIENLDDKKKKNELKKRYMENIKDLKAVLSGKLDTVRERLEKKMDKLSDTKQYEKAAEIRDRIERLDYITQPITPVEKFIENPNLIEDIRNEETKKLKGILDDFIKLDSLKRIECFDVSHLHGVHATASMVTFIGGEPDKNYYRHFKIRQEKGMDDVSSMKEVAKRRVKYLADWGVPDLILVDGGKTQVNAFLSIYKDKGIPIIGLAKKRERLVIPKDEGGFKTLNLKDGPAKNLVQRLRDEAHRFARRYHKKLLTKSLIPNN